MYALSLFSRYLNRLVLSERSTLGTSFTSIRSFASQPSEKESSSSQAIDVGQMETKKPEKGQSSQTIDVGQAETKEPKKWQSKETKTQKRPRSVFVSNIPINVGENELYLLFSKYGGVTAVRRGFDKSTGKIRRYAFCDFADESSAENAKKELNGYELHGYQLTVKTSEKVN